MDRQRVNQSLDPQAASLESSVGAYHLRVELDHLVLGGGDLERRRVTSVRVEGVVGKFDGELSRAATAVEDV